MKSIVALLAVIAAAVAGSAAAAPPPTTVACVAGGTTSFAHPPKGTTSVLFTYTSTVFFTWVSGVKREATPVSVQPGDPVVAAFYDGQTPIGDPVATTCS